MEKFSIEKWKDLKNEIQSDPELRDNPNWINVVIRNYSKDYDLEVVESESTDIIELRQPDNDEVMITIGQVSPDDLRLLVMIHIDIMYSGNYR